MRLIVGLDAPSAGRITVNGRAYHDRRFPLHEVGALLEAKAIHPSRSARNHLRWLAQSNGISPRRVDEVLEQVGTQRRCPEAGRHVLARYEPASRYRRRAARRSRGAAARRTGERTRPGRDPVGPPTAAFARVRGSHRVRLEPPDERDGAHRRSPDRDREGPAHRGRQRRRSHRASVGESRQGRLPTGRRVASAHRPRRAPMPSRTATTP